MQLWLQPFAFLFLAASVFFALCNRSTPRGTSTFGLSPAAAGGTDIDGLVLARQQQQQQAASLPYNIVVAIGFMFGLFAMPASRSIGIRLTSLRLAGEHGIYRGPLPLIHLLPLVLRSAAGT